MDETIFEHLQKADWDDIAVRLTDYAVKKARRYRWRTGTAIGGESAEDLAFEAIKRVLDGDRKWDPQGKPDIFQYLTGVVDSLLSHLSKSPARILVQSFPESEDGEILEELLKKADPESDTAKHLARRDPTPEDLLLEKEQERLEQAVYREIVQSFEGNGDLETIFLCIMDGVCKSSDISKVTGMDIKDVYQLRRKLNRRIVQFSKKTNFEESLSERPSHDA